MTLEEYEGVGHVTQPDGAEVHGVAYRITVSQPAPGRVRRMAISLRPPGAEAHAWLYRHPNGLTLTLSDGSTLQFGVGAQPAADGWVRALPQGPVTHHQE